MLLYSVAMTLALLLIVRYFKDRVGVYYPLPALLMMIFMPTIFGMIPGFIMTEEKGGGTIQALKVTQSPARPSWPTGSRGLQ